MNDNFDPDRQLIAELFRNLNIGANGRWFIALLVAISLWAGHGKLAVVLAGIVGVCVVIEQIPQPWSGVGAMIVYALTAAIAVALLVIA